VKEPETRPRVGLTFDDVLLVPRFSDILSRKDARTGSKFSRGISLEIPIVSANMDTVTESTMAIAIARLGGIGVIHRFLSVEEQVSEVVKVKRSEGIMIERPFTILPDRPVSEAVAMISEHDIGGIVVTDARGRVAGLVTRRDVVLEDDLGLPVSRVMTPLRDLVTAPRGVSMERAKGLLQKNKIEKLPVLDRSGRLVGLITSKDILKRRQYPNATKDRKGRLRVAAAIGVKGDYMERTKRLVEADVDAVVIDIAHGHSANAVETIKKVKREFGDIEVVGGNVATAKGSADLIRAGADAVKVGVGSGSICVTRVVTGFGVPQLTAILDGSSAARDAGVPVIGDGGIRNPGDVSKAIAAGASTVMIGSLFAGTEESPGPTILREGVRYKFTRGMASLAASIDRKVREGGRYDDAGVVEEAIEEGVPEGVEGLIPYKGKVSDVVKQLVGGLRSGMSYCGAKTIEEMQAKAEFIRITPAGYKESLPHDIERVA
jgi:IMP dehydrogenase